MRRLEIAVTAAATVSLTGVQGVAPALPALQADLGITAAEISFVTIAYVLAAALVAFPVSAFGDRYGERPVIAGALLVFAACGPAVFLVDALPALVAVRFVQGAAFGVVLSLSIAAVSHSVDSVELARAQRTRLVAMAAGEVVFPLVSGTVLLFASWQWVFALQAVALPVAVLCWWALPAARPAPPPVAGPAEADRTPRGGFVGAALGALGTPFGAAVQVPGFVRFFVKFTILSYVPLLAADAFGLSPLEIAVMIGASAFVAASVAVFVPALLRRWSVGALTFAALVLAALPIALVPVTGVAGALGGALLVALVVVSGLGDGMLGVLNNVSASLAAPPAARSAFLGATGSIRNLGKLVAPALLGALTVAVPLGGAIAVVGVLGLAGAGSVPAISRGVRRAASTRPGPATPPGERRRSRPPGPRRRGDDPHDDGA
ncbi:MFS transporter [Agromyces mediolanus]|uniref:MFS transporter n=1 Tax=Agromyces mediolanus TaxID=41986 RepID=UPI003835BC9A